MIVKTFTIEFDFGEILYFKTDKEQVPRMCTGWLVDGNNTVLYRIESATDKSQVYCYATELSRTKDTLLTAE